VVAGERGECKFNIYGQKNPDSQMKGILEMDVNDCTKM
jgi:hypothetical protein